MSRPHLPAIDPLMRALLVFAMLSLAACGPVAGTLTPPPPMPVPAGQVVFLTPQAGSVIYAEMLSITGTSAEIAGGVFEVAVLDPDGSPLARAVVRSDGGPWSLELRLGYIGEPLEATLTARPLDSISGGDYAQQTIALAGLEFRPAGAFGRIDQPAAEMTVGGESLPVSGTSSGIESDEILLRLIGDDDQEISRQIIAAGNRYRLDEIPWTAALDTRGYTGPATLQLNAYSPTDDSSTLLAATSFWIDTAAG